MWNFVFSTYLRCSAQFSTLRSSQECGIRKQTEKGWNRNRQKQTKIWRKVNCLMSCFEKFCVGLWFLVYVVFCQTTEKLIICLLKGDKDQQYVAILVEKSEALLKAISSDQQQQITLQKGKVLVAWVRVSKRQATRKSEKMSWCPGHSSTEGHEPPKYRTIPIFADISRPHNSQR